jgi:hypothetical protein
MRTDVARKVDRHDRPKCRNRREDEQARLNSNENAARSTKLIAILPLITVWLQVRVLLGPLRISISCLLSAALSATSAPETAPDTSTVRSRASSRRRRASSYAGERIRQCIHDPRLSGRRKRSLHLVMMSAISGKAEVSDNVSHVR